MYKKKESHIDDPHSALLGQFFQKLSPGKAGNPADTQKKKRLIKKIPT